MVHSSITAEITSFDVNTGAFLGFYTDQSAIPAPVTYSSIDISDAGAFSAGATLNPAEFAVIRIDSRTQHLAGNHHIYNIFLAGGVNPYVGNETVTLTNIYDPNGNVSSGNVTFGGSAYAGNPMLSQSLAGKNSLVYQMEIDSSIMNNHDEMWFEIKESASGTNTFASMNSKPITATPKGAFYFVLVIT